MILRRHFLPLLAAPVFATTNPASAQEMVGVAHRDLNRVRALAAQNPGLVRATIDWGFGDWETALGAASHVGNREIAEFLLANGATPTIFSAAMLGQLDLVKAFLATSPDLAKSYGPHGITLLAHARPGTPVHQYLTDRGDANTPLPTQPLAPADRDLLPGRYGQYTVDLVRDRLGINSPGAPGRTLLHHAGNFVFFPSGAPWAKLAFERTEGVFVKFTLTGIGEPVVNARVG